MDDPRNYGTLTSEGLRAELVGVSANLANLHKELGFLSSEQHKAYLSHWVASPGGSVAGKNREAEFNTREITSEIISVRAQINEATTNRDLLVFLLLSVKPSQLRELSGFDEDGLMTAHG